MQFNDYPKPKFGADIPGHQMFVTYENDTVQLEISSHFNRRHVDGTSNLKSITLSIANVELEDYWQLRSLYAMLITRNDIAEYTDEAFVNHLVALLESQYGRLYNLSDAL